MAGGRPRRSASDSLKGTTVPKEAAEQEVTTPAGAEADKTADAPAEGATPEAQQAEGAPETADGTDGAQADAQGAEGAQDAPADADADQTPDDDGDDWEDATVAARVTTDAFNYLVDGIHHTARKGEVIQVSHETALRGAALNALVPAEDQD